jgi:integrase
MKIKVIKKPIKGGKSNLYLEFYHGYLIDSNGKKTISRTFEKLDNLQVYDAPKNKSETNENKEAEILAEKVKKIREVEAITGKFKLEDKSKPNISFLEYFKKIMNERLDSKGNYDNWDATYKHLIRYCAPSVVFKDIDIDFVKGFKNHLEMATTKSNTILSKNSKYTYYNKFKACMREAFNDGLIPVNYASKVKSFPQADTHREHLTYDELQSIALIDCKYPILKKAFLLSCLTGLRWSDINKLVWSEIKEENEIAKIVFRQKKTDSLEYLYISAQSKELLGNRSNNSDRVFKGLKYGQTYNTELLRWMMRASINKHITFHSARHTCAVLLLEMGADIYTVSKMLGHKELKTTQIYAKIVDKKMQEASTIIPTLNIKF